MKNSLIVEVYQGTDKEWNQIIRKFSNVSVYQTSQWAHYCEEEFKQKYIRCIIYDKLENDIIGACLVLVQNWIVAKWYYGPLIHLAMSAELSEVDIVMKFLDFLKSKGLFIYRNCSLPAGLVSSTDQRAIIETAYRLNEWGTYVIDLQGKTEDEVWFLFDRSVRKNIRKCERKHIEVVRLQNLEEVERIYLPILRRHRERLGFSLPPAYPNGRMWKWLRSEDCILEVFLAHRNQVPLAGLGIIGFGGNITEVAVAQSDLIFTEGIPAQDLIKWVIIKWGLITGLNKYDLGGVSPSPSNDKEANIHRFKKKFGGSYQSFWQISTRKRWLLSKIIGLIERGGFRI